MWRGLDAYEAATGIVVPERGPYDPDNDPLWQQRVAGEIGYYDYWDVVAAPRRLRRLAGLYRGVSEVVPDSLVVQESVAFMQQAEACGQAGRCPLERCLLDQRSGVLRGRPEFRDLDAFVDSTDVGVRKPAPEPYLAAAKALGVDPSARRLPGRHTRVRGRRARRRDVRHPRRPDGRPDPPSSSRVSCWASCPSRGASTRPHRRGGVPRARPRRDHGASSTPMRSCYWDGERVASGADEVRRFHVERLGFGEVSRRDDELDEDAARRSRRHHRGRMDLVDPARVRTSLTLRGDLIVEWHATTAGT